MLRQLSSSHDNGQSMVKYTSSMKHAPSSSHDNGQRMLKYPSSMNNAPSVVIVLWQRSEHGSISVVYETCSVSFHRLMTTDRAWLFIPKICNMLCQLSSSNYNGQSRVIPPSSMKHARSAVIVSWQRSEHGSVFVRYDTCTVICHCLLPMVGARLFIP